MDEDDPNETPYLLCPAEQEFKLALRSTGSGRSSLDVLTPSGRRHRLHFDEAVTRHMMHLDREVTWFLDGAPDRPRSAFIVRVHEHGNVDDPSQTIRTWHVLVRASESESCIVAKAEPEEAILEALDRIEGAPCLQPQPPRTAD
ncbi:MAG: hypothetical protein AAF645_07350 [Myxococcota bacterium]